MVDVCGFELPTNVQNFTKQDLTEVKIFQKAFTEATFLKHHVYVFRLNTFGCEGA